MANTPASLRDVPDKPRLVTSLRLLLAYYEGDDSASAEQMEVARTTIATTITAYAMGALVRRLVGEGHVIAASRAELLERAGNLQKGLGFLLQRELQPEPPKPSSKPSIEDDLRDFLS